MNSSSPDGMGLVAPNRNVFEGLAWRPLPRRGINSSALGQASPKVGVIVAAPTARRIASVRAFAVCILGGTSTLGIATRSQGYPRLRQSRTYQQNTRLVVVRPQAARLLALTWANVYAEAARTGVPAREVIVPSPHMPHLQCHICKHVS